MNKDFVLKILKEELESASGSKISNPNKYDESLKRYNDYKNFLKEKAIKQSTLEINKNKKVYIKFFNIIKEFFGY
jgi:hypothetical protein